MVNAGKWCCCSSSSPSSKCSSQKWSIKQKTHQINRLLCLSCLMFLAFLLFSIEGSEKGPLARPQRKWWWRGLLAAFNPTNLQFTTHKPHINCSWKREDYQTNQSPSSPSSSLDETNLMRLTHCHLNHTGLSNGLDFFPISWGGSSTYKYLQYPSNFGAALHPL